MTEKRQKNRRGICQIFHEGLYYCQIKIFGGSMTTIYLIRHAEAEGNLYRIAQGQKNSNLTDRG